MDDVKEALQAGMIGKCSPQQYKLLLAYMSAHLIYPNAQRPGVVQYMTIAKYQNKEEHKQGTFLIKVLHHKTSSGNKNQLIHL